MNRYQPLENPAFAGEHRERGSGTVLVLCECLVALTLCVALVAIGAARQTRIQTQSAADLAAIAAATAIQTGYEPCPTATQTAGKMGVTLASCRDEGSGIVSVEARRNLTDLPFGWGGQAEARARAGPATAG